MISTQSHTFICAHSSIEIENKVLSFKLKLEKIHASIEMVKISKINYSSFSLLKG